MSLEIVERADFVPRIREACSAISVPTGPEYASLASFERGGLHPIVGKCPF